ncbi:MAG: ABC transporter permease [Spirochaetales bacterium]|jgi:riboflavin transport system permease protein|nr:ABC transporter permease [Spirochaetales bacterium]
MKHKRRFNELMITATGLGITIGASIILAIVLIFVLSRQPGTTIYYFFLGPFANKYYLGNMLNSAIPLVFTGLGIAVAFKSSVFNLGGEGQIYAGALITTVVCLALPNFNGLLGGVMAIVAGMLTGAILAGLSGYFKMKWGTDLLISSFLISGAVVLIVNFFITGPLDDPESALLTTSKIAEQYRLLQIFKPSKLDISIFFSVVTAVLILGFMYYTHWGYEMRMCGLNSEFARYGGVNVSTYIVLPMIMSGALHGLGGGLAVMGTYHMALKEFTFGLGWNGIAVALIAKNHPLGVIPAAIFFAYLDAGAKAAMLHSDVTFEIAAIIQSIIFYLVTAQAIYSFIRNRRRTGVTA